MSYFLKKIDQVKKFFLNKETREPEKTNDNIETIETIQTIKKIPDKIEIKTDSDLEKNDSTKDMFNFSNIIDENMYDADDDDDADADDDIYDNMPYTFKNLYSEQVSTYHYINDRLTRTFGTCMDYDSIKYKLHFCIFSINDNCHFKGYKLPFLQFAFEKKPNIFSFPSIEFNCPGKQIQEKTDTSQLDEDEDVYFKNECIKKLLDIFEIDKIDESMMEEIYKGFLEFDENNIFVVFDLTNYPSVNFKTEKKQNMFFLTTEVEKYEWGIIDEIRKKEIQKIPIENIVLDFFQKYRYMNEIKTNNRTLLQIPSSLYLCKYENDSYTNITESMKTNFEKRSQHPHLGFFYFFLQTGSKRYAVFSENNIVLDRSFEKMKEIDINEYNSILLNKSVFEYVENNQSIWCVKPDSLFCEL
jgi:hypothetical protein